MLCCYHCISSVAVYRCSLIERTDNIERIVSAVREEIDGAAPLITALETLCGISFAFDFASALTALILPVLCFCLFRSLSRFVFYYYACMYMYVRVVSVLVIGAVRDGDVLVGWQGLSLSATLTPSLTALRLHGHCSGAGVAASAFVCRSDALIDTQTQTAGNALLVRHSSRFALLTVVTSVCLFVCLLFCHLVESAMAFARLLSGVQQSESHAACVAGLLSAAAVALDAVAARRAFVTMAKCAESSRAFAMLVPQGRVRSATLRRGDSVSDAATALALAVRVSGSPRVGPASPPAAAVPDLGLTQPTGSPVVRLSVWLCCELRVILLLLLFAVLRLLFQSANEVTGCLVAIKIEGVTSPEAPSADQLRHEGIISRRI